jgi:hypothetical protein
MKGLRNVKTLAALLAFGVLLAGCSTPSAVSIPAPTVQGPTGHHFALSFLKTPKEKEGQGGIVVPMKGGERVQSSWYWASPKEDAFVYELTSAVPPARVNSFLRGFLPTSSGGRIVAWHGLPAAIESVPCSTPAGSCAGFVSALVVLDDRTIFDILVSAPTKAVTQAVFNSFRLIK